MSDSVYTAPLKAPQERANGHSGPDTGAATQQSTPIRQLRPSLRDSIRRRMPDSGIGERSATAPVDPNRGLFRILEELDDKLYPDGRTPERVERESNLQEIEQSFTPNDLARFVNLVEFMDLHGISNDDVWTIIRRGWQHQARAGIGSRS